MIDEKMVLLGQRIKDRRTELKYTQAELAEMVGYTSDSIITKVEKGEADPPRSKIIALADDGSGKGDHGGYASMKPSKLLETIWRQSFCRFPIFPGFGYRAQTAVTLNYQGS